MSVGRAGRANAEGTEGRRRHDILGKHPLSLSLFPPSQQATTTGWRAGGRGFPAPAWPPSSGVTPTAAAQIRRSKATCPFPLFLPLQPLVYVLFHRVSGGPCTDGFSKRACGIFPLPSFGWEGCCPPQIMISPLQSTLMPPALCYPCGLWAYSHLPNRFAGPSKSGRRGRPLCLSGGSFHLGSESDVVACALRSLSVGTAEEREPATLRCPTATTTVRPPRRPPRRPSSAPGRRKQSSFIGERRKGRFSCGSQRTARRVPPQPEIAEGERAPLRGRSALDARSCLPRRGSSPSCHSTPPGLPRWFRERQARPAAEMAKVVVVVFVGPLVARLSAAAWWACWIERSAWVDALPTSCMVSCRYVVVFA